MFHCPVGVWVIEQYAIILNATVRSPTVNDATWVLRRFKSPVTTVIVQQHFRVHCSENIRSKSSFFVREIFGIRSVVWKAFPCHKAVISVNNNGFLTLHKK